jgi:hypothetical protein
MKDRFQLAKDYDVARERVFGIFDDHGYGPRHSSALNRLWELSKELHDAERAAGVAIGSTRERKGHR